VKEELDALDRFARLALTGPAGEEGLREAASILRRATGATGAAIVYVVEQEFLICGDGGEGPDLEFSQMGLWLLQRQIVQIDGPVGFNLHGHRLEEFAPAESGKRDFLAFAIPFSGTAAEMCILRGPRNERAWAAALGFVGRTLPSLAVLAGRVLDAEGAQRQRNQLAALANAGQVLIRSHDAVRALTDMATALATSTGYTFVGIDVYDASADRFLFRVINEDRMSKGPLAQFWRDALNPDRPDPLYVQVVKTRQPALLPDLQNDGRVPEPIRQFFQRSLLRSAAMFPMLFQDEVLGVLGVVSYRPLSFLAEEVRFLESLAAEVATALGAMRTHRELVESRQRLERYTRRIERQRAQLARSRAELEKKSALLERALETEREHARRDPLTGVLNHAAIVEELRSHLSDGNSGAPCAVAMIDVDDLKATNDTFGHQVGDAVLVAVARAIFRDGVLVGRYGGDEFVAVLPGADRQAAERYREEVLGALTGFAMRDPQSGAKVPALVSIGVSTYPTEAARIEELIAVADSGMYSAKRQRPVRPASVTASQPLGDERAAKMVGEIVPLLTSPGDLDDKLRVVAQRLSVAAGYDAVNFGLWEPGSEAPPTIITFAQLPQELLEGWKLQQANEGQQRHPMRLLAEHGRPIILDDPQNDPRLTDIERQMMSAGGIRSALVAPMLWQNELIGMLTVASEREAAFGPRDAQFLTAVASQVTAIVCMAALVEELRLTSGHLAEAQAETVMLLAAAAEAHDRTTGQHLQNVRAITQALARELGRSEEDARELGLAAVLHDIGKIRVPDSLLANVGRLTDDEWDLMKRHTAWGEEFLKGRPGFELAATIARSHHEHWDGSGYPNGLAGQAIPEGATVVSVADAFDAMTNDRPYRAARSVAAAVREILACSGKQFNPKAAKALLRLHKRGELPPTLDEAQDEKAAA